MKKLLLFCLVAVALLIQGEANKSNKTNTEPGPKGMVEIDGETYFFAGVNSVPWYVAEARCKEMNMQLLTFEDRGKWNSFLHFIIANPVYDTWWWTSGHKLPQTSDFFWSSTGGAFEFTQWLPGTPKHPDSNDACVTFFVEKGGWSDEFCTDYYPYICENIA